MCEVKQHFRNVFFSLPLSIKAHSLFLASSLTSSLQDLPKQSGFWGADISSNVTNWNTGPEWCLRSICAQHCRAGAASSAALCHRGSMQKAVWSLGRRLVSGRWGWEGCSHPCTQLLLLASPYFICSFSDVPLRMASALHLFLVWPSVANFCVTFLSFVFKIKSWYALREGVAVLVVSVRCIHRRVLNGLWWQTRELSRWEVSVSEH